MFIPKRVIFEKGSLEYKLGKELYDIFKKKGKEILENQDESLGFEVIIHRYTIKAKNRILEIFPETTLPMNEEERKFKYGQFGYGKYIYNQEDIQEIKDFFKEEIKKRFPLSTIKYII